MRNRFKAAVSAVALVSAALLNSPALADDTWACQVALCASNPGGWMQFAECVPPIKKLITHLATGGSFPVCKSGGFTKADYTKPKNGRPGSVLFRSSDGTNTRYTVPSAGEVAQAEAQVPAAQ